MIRAALALPIAAEPLTLDEGKLRANLDWTVGDPRDALMLEFISAARQQVEQDTGIAVPEQTRDLYFDALPTGLIPWHALPPQTAPVVDVVALSWADAAGVITALAPADYTVTQTNDGLTITVAAPPAEAVRWILRVVSGFDPIPPSLLHAVGLLTAHYATVGRDATIVGTIVAATPFGYLEAVRAFALVALP